jgi:hypothetical protein
MEPPQLSSDEEDDKEYIAHLEERNSRARLQAQRDRERGEEGHEGDARNVLLNSIRHIIS